MQPAQKSPEDRFYWLGGFLLALSLAARAVSLPIITSDYTYFLSKWFDMLQNHPGFTAFAIPFSDYAPMYLYFIKLLTFVPMPSLYSIKLLSMLFDVAVAMTTYFIIKKTAPRAYTEGQLFFAFALVFSIPTFVLNSSLWGQSDAVYAAGVLVCLYFVLTDRPLPAIVAFSFAFSIKLQAIFFLPVLVGYCLRKEKSAGYLLFIPLLYFVSIIPARLGGGSLGSLLLVYAHETAEYPSLSVSAQSIFALLGNYQFTPFAEHYLFLAGLVAAGLCALGVAALVYHFENLSARGMVMLSLVCVVLLPYLLPRMHERYFYLADLFSVLYVFYNPRRWYVPLLIVGTSLVSYMAFLSQVSWFSHLRVSLFYPSLVLLPTIAILLFESYRAVAASDTAVS